MQEYRRVVAEIDMDAILHNFDDVKKRLNKGTKILAVLKADGYGHGAVPVADLLKDKIDYFGVSIIEEAKELRQSGIKNPILIFGYTSPDHFDELLRSDVEQTIFQLDVAQKLSCAAVAMGKTAKIHIEVDTGMTRLGLSPDAESLEIVKQIATLPNIEIKGIYTHFACADFTDKTSEKEQRKLFLEFLRGVEKSGISIPIKHICNSAAVVDDDDYFADEIKRYDHL
ncbi:MAG: alanine racemase [Eubacteriales bacterium]